MCSVVVGDVHLSLLCAVVDCVYLSLLCCSWLCAIIGTVNLDIILCAVPILLAVCYFLMLCDLTCYFGAVCYIPL